MTDRTRDPAAPPEPTPDTQAYPAEDQAPPPPPAKPAPKPRGGASVVLVLFLFLVTGGGLYYVWTNPKPVPDSPALAEATRRAEAAGAAADAARRDAAEAAKQAQALAERLDRLEKAAPADTTELQQRLAALAAQVQALGSRPAEGGAPAASVDLGPITQQIADLAQKVEQADAAERTATEQLQAAQKQAVETLAAAQQATAALAERVQKLEQGAGQVESAADRAARLTRVQAAVVALQAGDKLGEIPGAPPALARFATVAPPTEAQLRETFPEIAAHAREVSRPDVSQKSFLARTLTRLQQSVTVRQGEDVIVGDPAAGVLAEAEEKVHAGDLKGAIEVLGRLNGPAAEAVRDWTGRAQALIEARAALAALAAKP